MCSRASSVVVVVGRKLLAVFPVAPRDARTHARGVGRFHAQAALLRVLCVVMEHTFDPNGVLMWGGVTDGQADGQTDTVPCLVAALA